jgi:hypothetical protein
MLNLDEIVYIRKEVFESLKNSNPTQSLTVLLGDTERVLNFLLTGTDPSLPPRQGHVKNS